MEWPRGDSAPGRSRKEDAVSAGAGVMCLAKEGEVVEKGQPLFELYADDEAHLEAGRHAIDDAVTFGDEPYAVRLSPKRLLIRD